MKPVRTSDVEGDEGLASGEFLMTATDFRQIADMLHADAGIHLPESKATLVYSRLIKRLRALGLKSFRDYCALVAERGGADERQQMLAALTTNVTRFFREPHHFEHLRKDVLPTLIETAKRGGRVRLWSAACSNGAEPYSIALTLLSAFPNVTTCDVKILATDIDPNMVAEASAGLYNDAALQPVPADLRLRYFTSTRHENGKMWQASDALRSLIGFRELNLVGSWPMRGKFDVIFCRNVVIYFEEGTQARLWSRFVPHMMPGGRLYIGHSERLSGPAATMFESEGITTYRLKEGARAK
ncbi:MAG TPA: protein-glutamate O-methyltransferase [Methylovirgula sp.]|jgi:chemotaxis protein methyltransferase CheR